MPKLQRKNIVAQSNKLIEGRYSASKNEIVLLTAMISLIEPKDKEFLTFSVSLEELGRILKLDKKSAIKEFKKISRRLIDRKVEVENNGVWELFPWVVLSRLVDNRVYLKFNDELKPYLLELKEGGNFTQYKLEMASRFKSTYTIRIYQLLAEYSSKGINVFEFSLDEFRAMMLGSNNDKYKDFKRFRFRVINSPQKELSEITRFDTNSETPLYKSDLNFDLETRRTGRKISHLIFTIKQQRTKPTKIINPDEDTKETLSPIILEYHKFGLTTDQVNPFLEERGEEALKLTLKKIEADHKAGKIKSNVPAYAFKLLRENAGQKTPQEKAEEERQVKLKAQREKEEKQKKREALKHTLEIEFGDMARKNFLLSLSIEEKADIQYKIIQELQEAGNDMFIPHILRDLGSRKVGSFLNKHIPNFNEDKKVYIQEKLKEKGLL